MDLFFVSIPLGALLIVFFAQYFWRFVINYEVTQEGICLLLFRVIRIMRIKYDDIVATKLLSWKEVLTPWRLGPLLTLRLGNRLIGQGC
jgi:hypothetical protein